MIEKYITDDNFLNIYRFGSHVYGTNNKNSDEDFICVVKERIESPDVNIHLHTENEFQTHLDNHDIQALECYFLPKDKILKKTIDFKFTLDKNKLRHAISIVSNGAWVKGKKKLTVQADYNKILGIKSVFHAIRILGFGIDIAKNEKINKYNSYNRDWEDIEIEAKHQEGQVLWDKLEWMYKNTFNQMKKKFASLCPLGYDKNDIKMNQLVELLKNHNIENEHLASEIYNIFVKKKKDK